MLPEPPGAARWRRVADVFDAVADLPPAERTGTLDRYRGFACDDDGHVLEVSTPS